MIALLAHGSPDPRHAADVRDLTAAVAQVLSDREVRPAYLDHHGPTLDEVAVAGRDAGQGGALPAALEVLPLLLSAGLHARVDVPALVAGAREVSGGAVNARPKLPPRLLAPAVLATIRELVISLGGRLSVPPATPTARAVGASTGAATPARDVRIAEGDVDIWPVGVVGAIAGSARPGAANAFEDLAAVLRPAGVELVLANGPDGIGPAAELLELLGVTSTLVVPLLFADGVLADRIAAEAGRLDLPVSEVIGRRAETAQALASWLVRLAGT